MFPKFLLLLLAIPAGAFTPPEDLPAGVYIVRPGPSGEPILELLSNVTNPSAGKKRALADASPGTAPQAYGPRLARRAQQGCTGHDIVHWDDQYNTVQETMRDILHTS